MIHNLYNIERIKIFYFTLVFAMQLHLNYQMVLAGVSQTTDSVPVSADFCASCLVYGVFLFPPRGEGYADERRTWTF